MLSLTSLKSQQRSSFGTYKSEHRTITTKKSSFYKFEHRTTKKKTKLNEIEALNDGENDKPTT